MHHQQEHPQPTDMTEDDAHEQLIEDLATDLLLGTPIKRRGHHSKADFDDVLARLLDHPKADAAVLEAIRQAPRAALATLCHEIARELAEDVLDSEADFLAVAEEDGHA